MLMRIIFAGVTFYSPELITTSVSVFCAYTTTQDIYAAHILIYSIFINTSVLIRYFFTRRNTSQDFFFLLITSIYTAKYKTQRIYFFNCTLYFGGPKNFCMYVCMYVLGLRRLRVCIRVVLPKICRIGIGITNISLFTKTINE